MLQKNRAGYISGMTECRVFAISQNCFVIMSRNGHFLPDIIPCGLCAAFRNTTGYHIASVRPACPRAHLAFKIRPGMLVELRPLRGHIRAIERRYVCRVIQSVRRRQLVPPVVTASETTIQHRLVFLRKGRIQPPGISTFSRADCPRAERIGHPRSDKILVIPGICVISGPDIADLHIVRKETELAVLRHCRKLKPASLDLRRTWIWIWVWIWSRCRLRSFALACLCQCQCRRCSGRLQCQHRSSGLFRIIGRPGKNHIGTASCA